MAYHRFLVNSDYHAVVSDSQLEQLVGGYDYRLAQAEQNAEINFQEYLDQYYEIERVFRVGKSIRDYNSGVSYPAQVYLVKDDRIYKTLTTINGCRKPCDKVYWELLTDTWAIPDADRKPRYSQLHTYALGDIVQFGTEWWVCKVPNGYGLDNIQFPGVSAWKEVAVTPWEANMEWDPYQVCSYNGRFYMMVVSDEDDGDSAKDVEKTPSDAISDSEIVLSPEEDDKWAQIGEYSPDYEYEYGNDSHDYVFIGEKVYVPYINPNADKLVDGTNIALDDPRNINVVTHMVRLAVYYLHQMISPTNISETRRLMYEDSMTWLANASKFKINPRIPRKQDCDSGEKLVDWALETYQREFDPNDNMWLI